MLVVPVPDIVPGLKTAIFDPDLRDHLPDEGRDVPDNGYWQRHIADGSVTVGDAPAAVAAVSHETTPVNEASGTGVINTGEPV